MRAKAAWGEKNGATKALVLHSHLVIIGRTLGNPTGSGGAAGIIKKRTCGIMVQRFAVKHQTTGKTRVKNATKSTGFGK